MTAYELKALRLGAGLTQRQVAGMAMVTTRTVQHWENGSYPIPAHRVKLLASLKRKGKAR